MASDVAQSVELGLNMRKGTMNDVINTNMPEHKSGIQVSHHQTKLTGPHKFWSSDFVLFQVKDVMQTIQMRANHRTHAQNLKFSKAVRKILTRSFQVRASHCFEPEMFESRKCRSLILDPRNALYQVPSNEHE